MEAPEGYLRALTAPLARAREDSPLPVARFSLEAVAHAFVILGLLPAARAEEILAAQRPVRQDAGLRLLAGRTIRERRVSPAAPGTTNSRGGPAAIRWLEFSAGSGRPVRVQIVSSAAVLTGPAEPPWPTPAECYLAQFAPPARDWSLGSFASGTVELDTAAVVTAVADALLAAGLRSTLRPNSSG
jgi:hypothetical protein